MSFLSHIHRWLSKQCRLTATSRLSPCREARKIRRKERDEREERRKRETLRRTQQDQEQKEVVVLQERKEVPDATAETVTEPENGSELSAAELAATPILPQELEAFPPFFFSATPEDSSCPATTPGLKRVHGCRDLRLLVQTGTLAETTQPLSPALVFEPYEVSPPPPRSQSRVYNHPGVGNGNDSDCLASFSDRAEAARAAEAATATTATATMVTMTRVSPGSKLVPTLLRTPRRLGSSSLSSSSSSSPPSPPLVGPAPPPLLPRTPLSLTAVRRSFSSLRIVQRSQRPSAPTTFDEIFASHPTLGRQRAPAPSPLRHPPMLVRPATRRSLSASLPASLPDHYIPLTLEELSHLRQLSALASGVSSISTSMRPHIPYNSQQGYALLRTLRRLLALPASCSAAQTLVFVLRRRRLRQLALPRAHSHAAAANGIAWSGILQAMDGPLRYRLRVGRRVGRQVDHEHTPGPLAAGPSTACTRDDRDLVAAWLASGEALFTGRTALAAVLLRRCARRPRPVPVPVQVQLQVQAAVDADSSGDLICIASLYSAPRPAHDIGSNPRRRYHQMWQGAGRSRLSICTMASE